MVLHLMMSFPLKEKGTCKNGGNFLQQSFHNIQSYDI